MTLMEEKTLTKRQTDVFNFIKQYLQEMDCPPTIREIAKHFGFTSLRTVQCHLEALTKKQVIKIRSAQAKGRAKGYRLARGLRLVESLSGFPLLGRVPAGEPTWQADDVESTLDLKEMFPPGSNCFALRVKGDSMIQAGIMEGDVVLVRAQPTAQANDIVVALVDGDATVKRFTRQKEGTFLSPANPKYQPIPVTPAVQVSGKVIGVLRKYGG